MRKGAIRAMRIRHKNIVSAGLIDELLDPASRQHGETARMIIGASRPSSGPAISHRIAVDFIVLNAARCQTRYMQQLLYESKPSVLIARTVKATERIDESKPIPRSSSSRLAYSFPWVSREAPATMGWPRYHLYLLSRSDTSQLVLAHTR